jgi:hypothetical protein
MNWDPKLPKGKQYLFVDRETSAVLYSLLCLANTKELTCTKICFKLQNFLKTPG